MMSSTGGGLLGGGSSSSARAPSSYNNHDWETTYAVVVVPYVESLAAGGVPAVLGGGAPASAPSASAAQTSLTPKVTNGHSQPPPTPPVSSDSTRFFSTADGKKWQWRLAKIHGRPTRRDSFSPESTLYMSTVGSSFASERMPLPGSTSVISTSSMPAATVTRGSGGGVVVATVFDPIGSLTELKSELTQRSASMKILRKRSKVDRGLLVGFGSHTGTGGMQTPSSSKKQSFAGSSSNLNHQRAKSSGSGGSSTRSPTEALSLATAAPCALNGDTAAHVRGMACDFVKELDKMGISGKSTSGAFPPPACSSCQKSGGDRTRSRSRASTASAATVSSGSAGQPQLAEAPHPPTTDTVGIVDDKTGGDRSGATSAEHSLMATPASSFHGRASLGGLLEGATATSSSATAGVGRGASSRPSFGVSLGGAASSSGSPGWVGLFIFGATVGTIGPRLTLGAAGGGQQELAGMGASLNTEASTAAVCGSPMPAPAVAKGTMMRSPAGGGGPDSFFHEVEFLTTAAAAASAVAVPGSTTCGSGTNLPPSLPGQRERLFSVVSESGGSGGTSLLDDVLTSALPPQLDVIIPTTPSDAAGATPHHPSVTSNSYRSSRPSITSNRSSAPSTAGSGPSPGTFGVGGGGEALQSARGPLPPPRLSVSFPSGQQGSPQGGVPLLPQAMKGSSMSSSLAFSLPIPPDARRATTSAAPFSTPPRSPTTPAAALPAVLSTSNDGKRGSSPSVADQVSLSSSQQRQQRLSGPSGAPSAVVSASHSLSDSASLAKACSTNPPGLNQQSSPTGSSSGASTAAGVRTETGAPGHRPPPPSGAPTSAAAEEDSSTSFRGYKCTVQEVGAHFVLMDSIPGMEVHSSEFIKIAAVDGFTNALLHSSSRNTSSTDLLSRKASASTTQILPGTPTGGPVPTPSSSTRRTRRSTIVGKRKSLASTSRGGGGSGTGKPSPRSTSLLPPTPGGGGSGVDQTWMLGSSFNTSDALSSSAMLDTPGGGAAGGSQQKKGRGGVVSTPSGTPQQPVPGATTFGAHRQSTTSSAGSATGSISAPASAGALLSPGAENVHAQETTSTSDLNQPARTSEAPTSAFVMVEAALFDLIPAMFHTWIAAYNLAAAATAGAAPKDNVCVEAPSGAKAAASATEDGSISPSVKEGMSASTASAVLMAHCPFGESPPGFAPFPEAQETTTTAVPAMPERRRSSLVVPAHESVGAQRRGSCVVSASTERGYVNLAALDATTFNALQRLTGSGSGPCKSNSWSSPLDPHASPTFSITSSQSPTSHYGTPALFTGSFSGPTIVMKSLRVRFRAWEPTDDILIQLSNLIATEWAALESVKITRDTCEAALPGGDIIMLPDRRTMTDVDKKNSNQDQQTSGDSVAKDPSSPEGPSSSLPWYPKLRLSDAIGCERDGMSSADPANNQPITASPLRRKSSKSLRPVSFVPAIDDGSTALSSNGTCTDVRKSPSVGVALDTPSNFRRDRSPPRESSVRGTSGGVFVLRPRVTREGVQEVVNAVAFRCEPLPPITTAEPNANTLFSVLTDVSLCHLGLQDSDVAELIGNANSALTRLNLTGNNLTTSTVEALVANLRCGDGNNDKLIGESKDDGVVRCSTLQELILRSNRIDDTGAFLLGACLSDRLALANLRLLDVTRNIIPIQVAADHLSIYCVPSNPAAWTPRHHRRRQVTTKQRSRIATIVRTMSDRMTKRNQDKRNTGIDSDGVVDLLNKASLCKEARAVWKDNDELRRDGVERVLGFLSVFDRCGPLKVLV